MRKAILALSLIAALAPAAAMAKKPPAKPKSATYALKGTLSSFVAPSGDQAGSVTIAVSGGNKAGRAFAGQTLTFAVAATTDEEDDCDGVISDGEDGSVVVKAPAGATADQLQAATPQAVEDDSSDDDDQGCDGDGGGGGEG